MQVRGELHRTAGPLLILARGRALLPWALLATVTLLMAAEFQLAIELPRQSAAPPIYAADPLPSETAYDPGKDAHRAEVIQIVVHDRTTGADIQLPCLTTRERLSQTVGILSSGDMRAIGATVCPGLEELYDEYGPSVLGDQ